MQRLIESLILRNHGLAQTPDVSKLSTNNLDFDLDQLS